MAFIQRPGSSDGLDFYIFNVTHAVGSHAQNFWTDIMLVQYFIACVYGYGMEGNGWKVNLSRSEVLDLPDPNVDFKNLKKTERWIRRFQTDVNSQGGRLYVDGRIDRSNAPVTPKSKSLFSIVDLNLIFIGGEGGVDPLADALDDFYMPALLKSELIRSDMY